MTLEQSQQTPQTTADELEARRVIKECDTELANNRAALKTSRNETVARWISETEDRRKVAELRLRKLTTGEGMTANEIRDLVERMHGASGLLETGRRAHSGRGFLFVTAAAKSKVPHARV